MEASDRESSAQPQRTNAPVTRWLMARVGHRESSVLLSDRNKGLDLLGQRGDPVVSDRRWRGGVCRIGRDRVWSVIDRQAQ